MKEASAQVEKAEQQHWFSVKAVYDAAYNASEVVLRVEYFDVARRVITEAMPKVTHQPDAAGRLSAAQKAKAEAQKLWDLDAAARAVPKEITNSIGMKLMFIPPGKFLMGSPQAEKYRNNHEGPQHRVTITKGFYLGKYEVTQREYQAVMGSNPSWFSAQGDGKGGVQGRTQAGFR